MKFKILENPCNTQSKVLLTININDEFWYKWEKEQNKRFSELSKTNDLNLEVFDYDEARELWIMSLNHLISHLQFIRLINKIWLNTTLD